MQRNLRKLVSVSGNAQRSGKLDIRESINDSIGRLRDLVTNNSHSGDLPYTQYNHGGVPCTKASVLSAATTRMEFYDKSHQTLRVAREELEKQMETLEEQTHRTFHY
jgi:hypothetical protein